MALGIRSALTTAAVARPEFSDRGPISSGGLRARWSAPSWENADWCDTRSFGYVVIAIPGLGKDTRRIRATVERCRRRGDRYLVS